MSRLLIYVMTSDTGKAPEIRNGLCILEKCKGSTIVKGAKIGDWIMGIGGKMLSKACNSNYDKKLIYAMKVERENPPKSRYFTHYGKKAIFLDAEKFKKIIKVKRTEYIEDRNLYQKFDRFMRSERLKGRKGKIDSYCCGKICRVLCKHLS